MNDSIVYRPKMRITGVSVRTTNAEEAGPNGRIPQLWESYYRKDVAGRLGAGNATYLYSVYTDYESDASGAYTVVLGHELSIEAEEEAGVATVTKSEIDDAEVAQADGDLHSTVVQEGKYRLFRTEKGPMEIVVPKAWATIWEFYRESAEVRAYAGDYECYDVRNFNPSDTEVEIYIALK